MIDPRGRDLLGRGIAAILRIGTLVAIAAVGVGFVLLLLTDGEPGSPPLVALLQGGGAAAVIGFGLLGLTLLPVLVLAAAAVGFRRLREQRLVVTTVGVLVLLLGSLATAVVLSVLG